MGTEHVEHGWRVDGRCTNCDVARQLAPGLVGEVAGRSAVLRQPRDAAETARLHAAAHACPTRSVRPPDGRTDPARDPFPMPLDDIGTGTGSGTDSESGSGTGTDSESGSGSGSVLLCGHNSPHTAGANSYLLRRPDGTSMMIDTPRWSPALAARYEAPGPVTDVLLTHRDHAVHGRRYADGFGARLWIHEGDLDAAPDADRVLRGTEPAGIADGVLAVPFPGHTRGSVLYLADERYCFSGDSFYWSRTTSDIEVAESVTWYSIRELAASLARTAGRLRFEWLLPGHGDRRHLPHEEMTARLGNLATRTHELPPRAVDFTAVRW
ncbi:4Fe-4S domain-containing protein [Streptomyces sp. NPDC008092]|uniref:4Fe-4S domain-containing protein n=1 Tax=Streptomyces sp. NPDC008092 TaxID=3364808 RepID=UPI0036E0D9DE